MGWLPEFDGDFDFVRHLEAHGSVKTVLQCTSKIQDTDVIVPWHEDGMVGPEEVV